MRFTIASLLALVALVAASPAVLDTRHSENKCDNGDVWCCNSETEYKNFGENWDLATAFAALANANCSPIGVSGGTACSKSTVCCNQVQQKGLVNVACTPVNA